MRESVLGVRSLHIEARRTRIREIQNKIDSVLGYRRDGAGSEEEKGGDGR
jgi:hypothetical protein